MYKIKKGNKKMNRNAKIVKKHYEWREAEKAKLKAKKESAKENKEKAE